MKIIKDYLCETKIYNFSFDNTTVNKFVVDNTTVNNCAKCYETY